MSDAMRCMHAHNGGRYDLFISVEVVGGFLAVFRVSRCSEESG